LLFKKSINASKVSKITSEKNPMKEIMKPNRTLLKIETIVIVDDVKIV
jgi:hypothetical protein